MDINLAAVVVTAIVTLVTALTGSWAVAKSSTRNTQLAERESDRARIKALEDRDAEWSRRCDVLWAAREADARIKREQGDHIDVLEHHIWQQIPPPPPPRPTGV
jgi:Flp pilus assembly protein TadB